MRPSCSTVAVLIAACAASSAPANSLHEVIVIGFRFEPAEIEVEPGDTVRWIWTGNAHTVTSGADCTYDGLYFDGPIDSGNKSVEWEVPDITGAVPYFCRPHCLGGMVGTVTVNPAVPCPEDIDGCGTVDFADVIRVLSVWGPCKRCPEDLDGSGAADFGDILRILAAWGPCPS